MLKYLYTLLIFTIGSGTVFTQNITTTFRGTIKDAISQKPLLGATIHIFNIQFSSGSSTDSLGNFTIQKIPTGRYEAEISYLGYETLVLSEILLDAGKEKVLDIKLEESSSELQEVVVKSTTQNTTITPLSNHAITIEEVQRFPATFFDPARLAMLYPGVTGTNDQANGLSIRGLPPSLMQWRLEGVEIVNPNHLSNAGTISDQPSIASGGVNILSAQMLDNSRLFTGAFPVEYSNAIGGVMDMRLRKGNNEQYEYTAQAGLLGFDLGMEGPFSKNKKASFLFNYRYSFTGLLTNFGIDFDGEEIGFQDISFNLNFPTKKIGRFMAFGIGGMSSNFKKVLPMEEWEVDKDRKQIDFTSAIGIGGVKHQYNFKNILIETIVAYSKLKDDREEMVFNNFDAIKLQREKLSITHKWQLAISQKSTLVIGAQFLKNRLFNEASNSVLITPNREERDDSFVGGFINYTDVWWNKFIFNFGFNTLIRNSNNRINAREKNLEFNTVNPKFSLQLPIDNNASISYFIGLSDGLFPIVFRGQSDQIRRPKGSTFMLQQNVHYEVFYENKFKIKAEFFHQKLSRIPTIRTTINGNNVNNHLVNEAVTPFSQLKSSDGNHQSIGLELMLQKYFTQKAYYLFSLTLYQAKYETEQRKKVDGRYSGDFILNAVWGKEFSKDKKGKKTTFGFNLRGVINGSFHERKIFPTGGYFPEYIESLPLYFRTDLRLYLKKNKPNRTSTLSLDIQNATNHQNTAYHYFDTFSNEVKTQYQLGLIPLLNYRIEF